MVWYKLLQLTPIHPFIHLSIRSLLGLQFHPSIYLSPDRLTLYPPTQPSIHLVIHLHPFVCPISHSSSSPLIPVSPSSHLPTYLSSSRPSLFSISFYTSFFFLFLLLSRCTSFLPLTYRPTFYLSSLPFHPTSLHLSFLYLLSFSLTVA